MSAPALRRGAADIIRRLCVLPERLSVSEWADRYRRLPETSTNPGPYDSSVTPYARRPMDLSSDPETWKITLCWGSQTCKSTAIENVIAYRIARMPTPIVMLQPTVDAAQAVAKERYVPMIVATPELRSRVQLGLGTESTLRYKRFPGGFLYIASAKSGSEVAARSAPAIFADEIDLMEDLAGEGNPLLLLRKRQGAADIGLEFLTSTPRDAETTRVFPELEAGTNERFELPCPHCDHRQDLVFGGPDQPRGLKWPNRRPLEAEYMCESCSAMIRETAKRDMLAVGDWKARNPDAPAGVYSMHLNSLYSPFAMSGWGRIAQEFVDAGNKPADLQVFVNTRLAELWHDRGQEVKPGELQGRLESQLTERVVPNGAGALTIGIDVQNNRIEAYVWAWGHGLESWLIDAVAYFGDTNLDPWLPGTCWEQMDRYLETPFVHEHGQVLRLDAGFIDSGYQMSRVYYCAKRWAQRRRVFASKGFGDQGRPLLGKPTMQPTERIPLYPVGTDIAKTEFLRSQLFVSLPADTASAPGYVHLPTWLTDDQCNQLTSEVRKPHTTRGRTRYHWVKRNDDVPNEALDCRILSRAALELLGSQFMATLSSRATKWGEAQAAVPAARQGRRTRFGGVDV